MLEQPGLLLGKASAKLRRKRPVLSINTAIASAKHSEICWWYNNRDVIAYLDEGHTVKEIASLIDCGPRQIRVVRQRLNDLRQSGIGMQPAMGI